MVKTPAGLPADSSRKNGSPEGSDRRPPSRELLENRDALECLYKDLAERDSNAIYRNVSVGKRKCVSRSPMDFIT